MAQCYLFWSCPGCIHARDVDLIRMKNTCRLIDVGTSPIDGRVWEYADHDRCPAFQPKGNSNQVAHGRDYNPTLSV